MEKDPPLALLPTHRKPYPLPSLNEAMAFAQGLLSIGLGTAQSGVPALRG